MEQGEVNINKIVFGYTRLVFNEDCMHEFKYKIPVHLTEIIKSFYPRYLKFIEYDKSLIKVTNNGLTATLQPHKFGTI